MCCLCIFFSIRFRVFMDKQIQYIKNKVFEARPVLREIYDLYGTEKLKNYVQQKWQIQTKNINPIFLDCLRNNLQEIYGKLVADQIVEQLEKKPIVSTVGHHGIWGHPIFVNADLIYSLFFKPGEYALTLSTESVSLNNTTSWSGSVVFHNEQGILKRKSLFNDKSKTKCVYGIEDLEENKIHSFLESLGFYTTENFTSKDFSTQAGKISKLFWEAIFPEAPKLIYLPLETLVNNFLEKDFQQENSLFAKLLFSEHGRSLLSKYFKNEKNYLFWGVDEKGRRTKIETIPNNINSLVELIKQKKTYPSSPLCFMVLLYVGLVCVGGFTQTTWLTSVKEKFVLLLKELNLLDLESLEKINELPTKNFSEASLVWLKKDSHFFQPSFLDLFKAQNKYYEKFSNLAGDITLSDAIDLNLPTIYSTVIPKTEQIKEQDLKKQSLKFLQNT